MDNNAPGLTICLSVFMKSSLSLKAGAKVNVHSKQYHAVQFKNAKV